MMNKKYSEVITLNTFEERFNYLKLQGQIGSDTFGFDRYLNQMLYKSKEWKSIRDKIIIRDNGCDLGLPDHPIYGKIIVHHINPITIEDVKNNTLKLYDMNNLICTSIDTHNAIHYGSNNYTTKHQVIDRKPNDTCPWKHS